MFEKVKLVMHPAHLGASSSDDALDLIVRALSLKHAEKGEWADKYGARYEDDVILLHPFCWCEDDDCLWCGGSGCQHKREDVPHRAGCYQLRLQEFARQHGELLGVYSGVEHYYVPYGSKHQRKYDAFKRALCAELSQDYKGGNEVHCTCGLDAEERARYAACYCDWHAGRGIYRFGPAAYAPNFWHKPTNFQLRWYKYIGRDMEMNMPPPIAALRELVAEADVSRVIENGQESAAAFAAIIAEVNGRAAEGEE